jgi:hypothetical protein
MMMPSKHGGETLIAVSEGTSRIEIIQFLRFGDSVPVYRVWETTQPDNYMVYERLPEGGVGRILRVRDGVSDLEYVYDRDPVSQQDTVTVLNYRDGTFLKIGFSADGTSTTSLASGELLEAGDFTINTNGSVRYDPRIQRNDGYWVVPDPSQAGVVLSYEELPDGGTVRLVHERGPPAVGTQAVNLDYMYSQDEVTVLDHTTAAYARYDLTSVPPSLLETGSFVKPASGSIQFSPVSVAAPESLQPIAQNYWNDVIQIPSGTSFQLVSMEETSMTGVYRLTLTAGGVTYITEINFSTGQVQSAERIVPGANGVSTATQYDDRGRVTHIYNVAADGTRDLLKEYRYTATEVTAIDYVAKTIRISKLNEDGKTIFRRGRKDLFVASFRRC